MAQLSINDEIIANGRLTIKRFLEKDELGNEYVNINGVLATHLYFEEIDSIDSFRYRLDGISVVEENFGSEDHDIIYSFTADDLTIKNGMTVLASDYMNQIEETMYTENGFTKNSVYGKDV